MSKKSRDKGIRWEREVAGDLTDATSIKYERVLTEVRDGNSGDVRPRLSSDCDEIPVAAIHRTGRGGEKFAAIPWDDFLDVAHVLCRDFDFVVQCKCGARPDIYGAVKEAQGAV